MPTLWTSQVTVTDDAAYGKYAALAGLDILRMAVVSLPVVPALFSWKATAGSGM